MRTFSCQPNRTLPLTSPHPGRAMPLYKYFMRVSCASADSAFTIAGMSVAFVLFKIVTSVCRFKFYNAGRFLNNQAKAVVHDRDVPLLPLRSDRTAHSQALTLEPRHSRFCKPFFLSNDSSTGCGTKAHLARELRTATAFCFVSSRACAGSLGSESYSSLSSRTSSSN